MANTFTKLVALGTAVASIGAITFEFTPYSSKDSLIKQGVDSLKAIVQGKDEALAKLQAEYDEVMANLNDANASLETARQQLEAIYHKITGQTWDEANGDILNFDFNTLIKDGNQFENNVNGDAIAEILGLPAGSTTEQIIVAIQNLQKQIADLSTQVTNLQAQVQSLQDEIATYKAEESALVLDLQQQINDLKARAENEANAIIKQANDEEQEQLDYINNTIEELENASTAISQYLKFSVAEKSYLKADNSAVTKVIEVLDNMEMLDDKRVSPVLLHFDQYDKCYMSCETAFNKMSEKAKVYYSSVEANIGELYKAEGGSATYLYIKVSESKTITINYNPNAWINELGYTELDN